MSSGITLTAATRQNLLSLQGTADLLTQTQNRLSTGKKVNSALDDPTSFFTSQSLTGRSGDLGSLLNGISNGVQTIQAANQGITSIQKLVDSAKSTANQALADKSAVSSGKLATAATVSGSKSFQGLAGTADGTQDFSTLAKDGSVDISLDGGKTQTTIRLDSSTLKGSAGNLTKVTADQVASAINSQIANSTALKGKVSASVGSDGRIGFSTTSAGASQQLTVRGASGSTLDIGFGKDSTVGGPLGATTTLGAALSASNDTDFGTKSAQLTVSDGTQSVQVNLDANTAYNSAGDKLGAANTTDDQIVSAIQKQLTDAGSSFKVELAGGKLKFTSQEVGPDAAISVQDTGGDISLGTYTSSVTAQALTPGDAAAGTGNKVTAAGTFATQNFTTASSSFNISDGNKSVKITLDKDTSFGPLATDTLGNAAANGTEANVLAAINKQLSAAGLNITASNNGGKVSFSSGTPGTAGVVNVSGYRGTADIGFGTTAANASTSTVGTGSAAVGLSASGSDATDGSAKAIISGGRDITAAVTITGKDASFDIQLGSGNKKTIDLTASKFTGTTATGAQIVDEINRQFSQDTGLNGNVTASLDVGGKLQITSTKAGADQTITINAAQSGADTTNQLDIGFGQSKSSTPPKTLTNTGANSTGSTNSTRTTLSKQFNEILNQITQQAKDSSYNGINLLYRTTDDPTENSLKVTFNETGTSSLSISGAKLDSDGLGLTAVTGGFQTDDEINKTLTAITTATSQLRAQASTFGSNLSIVQNRQDFSKNLINILDTGAANLTNADLNEEAANSQALSTRQSIGISALSLANTAQQGILQLLR